MPSFCGNCTVVSKYHLVYYFSFEGYLVTERKATSSANDPHERKVDQEPTYDLTTYEGMRKAAIDFAGKNPKKAAAMGVMAALNPFLVPAIYLGNKAIDSLSNTFKDPVEVIDAQCKAAVDLIKAGKDNGAKKIKVTVDQQAGVDIGGKLEGYSMKFSFGSDNKMTIDVEY